MSEFSIILIIVCVFLSFMGWLTFLVIMNPHGIRFKAKNDNKDITQEISVTVDANKKRN